MKKFTLALSLLVLSGLSYGRPTKRIHLECQAVGQSKNWFKKIEVQGNMLRAGTMTVHLQGANPEVYPVRLRPATIEGKGVLAISQDKSWPLVLTTNLDKTEATLAKKDDTSAFKFKCKDLTKN